jgi:hypothetical protein
MQLAKKDPQAPEKPELMRPETRMALIFFDTKGLIYSNYIHKGGNINAKYMKKALARFLVIFRQKRPIMSRHETGILSLSKSPPPPQSSSFWWQMGPSKRSATLPIRPNRVPADFFLLPRLKPKLAGLSLS